MLKLYAFLLMLYPFLLAEAQQEENAKVFFIDTHNDVLSKQVSNGADLSLSQPSLNFDLVKASKGNLGAQVFSVWCGEEYGVGKAFAHAICEIDSLMALVKRNPDKMKFVTNSKELKKAMRQRKFAAMIGVEGGHMIEDRMDL
ncbi:MAG: rane dipeptidase [Segetibacter sp.]|nr:rane dipeptidase [Segetibacter sp.]